MKLRAIFHKEQPEFGLQDAFKQIRESRDFAEEINFDTAQLHCKGCIYSCPLSRAKCDTGKRAVPLLENCRK